MRCQSVSVGLSASTTTVIVTPKSKSNPKIRISWWHDLKNRKNAPYYTWCFQDTLLTAMSSRVGKHFFYCLSIYKLCNFILVFVCLLSDFGNKTTYVILYEEPFISVVVTYLFLSYLSIFSVPVS